MKKHVSVTAIDGAVTPRRQVMSYHAGNSPESVRVQVYGQVESTAHRAAIENAARRVTGVRAVENLIEVEAPPDATAAEVRRRVPTAIDVTVNSGVVHLDGRAPSLAALEHAVSL